MIRRIIIKSKFVLVLLIMMIAFNSCAPGQYGGNHPELYTVAISSILDTLGFFVGQSQSSVRVLDEDDFGRILFRYNEGSIWVGKVIMQKSDGDYVYFYQHYNFLLASREDNWEFSDEDIEALKEANSWNQEISDTREFARIRIVTRNGEGPVPSTILAEAFNSIFPERDWMHGRFPFLRTDLYGRAVYFATEVNDMNGVAVLFQPDNSIAGKLEITDRLNYQTELRLFMEEHGWGTPFSSE